VLKIQIQLDSIKDKRVKMIKLTALSDSIFRASPFLREILAIPLLFLVLTASPLSMAQHEMHGMSSAGDLAVTTMPGDNEVLAGAPDSLMLAFESDMRLVKLVIKESGKEIVDIGFRYRPVAGMHFMQNLPKLNEADYYAVEWAVLDGEGKLIKGSFHFSFGANARPPSYYLEQMEHPQHIMAPDYRLL
jgi:methionine-rich copper-binding protein CopC